MSPVLQVRSGSFNCRVLLFVGIVLVQTQPSVAQDEQPPRESPKEAASLTEPNVPTLRPPEVLRIVKAIYPQEALDARVEGQVVLTLVVADDGIVSEVEVLDGLGYGLDEAASEAVKKFVFVPASQNGVNIAARIRYGYVFTLPAEEPVDAGSIVGDQPSVAESEAEEKPVPAPSDDSAKSSTLQHQEPAEEVVVRGHRPGDAKRRSAEAVTVVDLARAKRESGDMADVLSRVEGVNVQRMGGLGSEARFSLAGYDDSQVRFFIDGIPLEYQGFSMGLQNVPLSFADRVDIYQGVVPVTLGSDSLGGAFNLITDRRTRGTHAFASYQGGSFATHRLAGGLRHLDEKTGLFVKTEGFFDSAENDYSIDVQAGDLTGEVVDLTVRRFHDAYRSKGINLEAGFVNRKWAARLLLKGFVNSYDKEIQHNALMTLPYGEAEYRGLSSGLNLRYEQDFGQGLYGTFVTGYVYDRTDFLDDPECVYDWYGECLIEIQGRGELRDAPTDQSVGDHTGYARWDLGWQLDPHNELILATAPTYFTRQGDNRLLSESSNFNELRAQRDMFKWINGVEYKSELFDERLENRFFVKNYLLATQSDEIFNDYIETKKNSQAIYWGIGNGARYAFNDWVLVKGSYEYAVRLPEPREIFGNSVQIIENLDLEPERSHNFNLSFIVPQVETKSGIYNANVNGFYRDADQLVLLVGRTDVFRYENAYEAHVYGVEGGASWLSPGDYLELGLNATYQEYRNRSDEGNFSQFKGDRIPNKPFFFGNAMARLLKRGLATPRDEASFGWYSRYTHEFLRGWESVGANYEQPEVPSQLVHTAVLTYLVRTEDEKELAFSAEGQNVTNEKVYDFYRVQKPGRAFYFKVSATY